MIHNDENAIGSTKIIPGVYYGGQNVESNFNFRYYGSSEWAPHQLDGEIRAGVWTIEQELDPEILFNTNEYLNN